MKAVVTEIQIGGGRIVHSLAMAVRSYVEMMQNVDGYRPKINFTILLPNNSGRTITIRDEDGETVAYGNFEGLPSFLDYSKEVLGK